MTASNRLRDTARDTRGNRFPRLARFFVPLSAIMLAVSASPSQAAAQDGVVYGRVINVDGRPLVGAEVRVGKVDGVTMTGDDGTFRVKGVPTGLYYFGVRQIGYKPVAELLNYDPGDTLRVTLERVKAVKELDTVKVQAREDARWERDLRRYDMAISAASVGNVVTAQEIDQRRPIVTSDLFLAQPGFLVVGAGGGARVVGSRARCSPAVYLDGLYSPGMRVNDVAPQAIELIVSYRGSSMVPSLFQDIRADPTCGTIAIFTL